MTIVFKKSLKVVIYHYSAKVSEYYNVQPITNKIPAFAGNRDTRSAKSLDFASTLKFIINTQSFKQLTVRFFGGFGYI